MKKRKTEEWDQRWMGDDKDDSCPDDVAAIKAGIPGKQTPPASEWVGFETTTNKRAEKAQRRKR